MGQKWLKSHRSEKAAALFAKQFTARTSIPTYFAHFPIDRLHEPAWHVFVNHVGNDFNLTPDWLDKYATAVFPKKS